MGEGIKEMEKIADEVLDESFSTSLSGSSRDFAESSSNTLFAFLLALVLIYLVLAAQFESFLDPFIIMITVPLALAGAVHKFIRIWSVAEYIFTDRYYYADWISNQKWYPDRGICQPEKRSRAG